MLTFHDAVSDLPEEAGLDGGTVAYATAPQNDYQRRMRDGATAVTEHVAPRHGSRMVARMRHIPEGKSAQNPDVRDKMPEHLRPGRCFPNSYARIRSDRPAPTITRNSGTPSSANCIHPRQPRALTIREAARCQSYRDTYRFTGNAGQKRLLIGNSVPPILGEALGRAARAMFADADIPPTSTGEQECEHKYSPPAAYSAASPASTSASCIYRTTQSVSTWCIQATFRVSDAGSGKSLQPLENIGMEGWRRVSESNRC